MTLPNLWSDSEPEGVPDKPEIFHSPEFRLDAWGSQEGYLQYGLTEGEFKELFYKCVGCNQYLTAEGHYVHICFYSETDAVLDDDFPDFACE